MNKEYSSVEEILQELLDLTIDYQNALNRCIEIAQENDDLHIVADLLNFAEDYSQIVDQSILLYDKIVLYKGEPSYDAHINSFFVLDNLKLLG